MSKKRVDDLTDDGFARDGRPRTVEQILEGIGHLPPGHPTRSKILLERSKKLLEHFNERSHDLPSAQAWLALIEKLEAVKAADRRSAAGDFVDVIVALLAELPAPGKEFDPIAKLISRERSAQAVEARGDQADRRRFQAWILETGVVLEQIGDLGRMRRNAVPDDVAQIISSRSPAVLKRWYKQVRPGNLKIGRKA
jgi:hypothetical protein